MRLADIDTILREKGRVLLHGGQRSKRTDVVSELIVEYADTGANVTILAPSSNFYRRLKSSVQTLKIHTVGSYLIAPVAFDCFELPVRTSLSVHKNRFSSAISEIYDFDSATTALFESALELAYEERGWNSLTEENRTFEGLEYGPDFYPTWSELIALIPQAGEKCGFEKFIMTRASSFLTSRLHRVFSDRNQYVFCAANDSMRNLASGFNLFELNGILLQEQLLCAFTLLNWHQSTRFAAAKKEHLFVIHFENEGAQSIQKQLLKSVWHFLEMAHDTSQVVIISKSNLLEIDEQSAAQFPQIKVDCETFENRINNFDVSKFEPPNIADSTDDEPISDESLRLRWIESGEKNKPFLSWGEEYSREAFKPEYFTYASKYAQDPALMIVYAKYVMSVFMDLTQLVHFRSQVINEIQRVIQCKQTLLRELSWSLIALITDKYFREKAAYYSWTFEEHKEIRSEWYVLIAPAFIPSYEVRRLDIKVLREYKAKLELLQSAETGPLRGCEKCEKKCQFGFDMATALDKAVAQDVLQKQWKQHIKLAEQMAWTARLLGERLMGKIDLDVSYCAAVHLIDLQIFSDDAKILTAHQTRLVLEKICASDLESESEKP